MAFSYLASMGALVAMNAQAMHRSVPVQRAKGQLREGFRYLAGDRAVGAPLLLMAIVGTLAFNYPVKFVSSPAVYLVRRGSGRGVWYVDDDTW